MILEKISVGLFYVATLACLVRAIVRTAGGLHILQLDGYKTDRYLKWIRQHLKNCFEVKEILVIGGCWFLQRSIHSITTRGRGFFLSSALLGVDSKFI